MIDRRQSIGSVLVLIVMATTGCTAPSVNNDDHADAMHLRMLASSEQKLARGDARGALEDLMQAAELAEPPSDNCPFAESTIGIADEMADREHYLEARLAYAIAIRFAEGCPLVDRSLLQQRQDDAALGMRASSVPNIL